MSKQKDCPLTCRERLSPQLFPLGSLVCPRTIVFGSVNVYHSLASSRRLIYLS